MFKFPCKIIISETQHSDSKDDKILGHFQPEIWSMSFRKLVFMGSKCNQNEATQLTEIGRNLEERGHDRNKLQATWDKKREEVKIEKTVILREYS